MNENHYDNNYHATGRTPTGFQFYLKSNKSYSTPGANQIFGSINVYESSIDQYTSGNYIELSSSYALLHEIGHMFDLLHPHPDDASLATAGCGNNGPSSGDVDNCPDTYYGTDPQYWGSNDYNNYMNPGFDGFRTDGVFSEDQIDRMLNCGLNYTAYAAPSYSSPPVYLRLDDFFFLVEPYGVDAKIIFYCNPNVSTVSFHIETFGPGSNPVFTYYNVPTNQPFVVDASEGIKYIYRYSNKTNQKEMFYAMRQDVNGFPSPIPPEEEPGEDPPSDGRKGATITNDTRCYMASSEDLMILNNNSYENLIIYSTSGQIIYKISLTKRNQRINIGNVPNGLFFCKLIGSTGEKIIKIVKQ